LSSVTEWSNAKLYRVELTGRLLLGVLVYAILPSAFYGDVQHYFDAAKHLGVHLLPYRDFVWEFPPLTTVPLLLIPIGFRSTVLFHFLFVALMIVCEWCCMQLLRRFDQAQFWSVTKYWSAVMIPMSLLAWNRLDYLSVLPATIGLIALVRGRRVARWIVVGFLAKLWPVLLCVGLFAQRRFRQMLIAMSGVVVATLFWYRFSPDGFHDFLSFRQGEGFQVESLPGSLLHFFGRQWFFSSGAACVSDSGWTWLQTAMPVLNIVSIAVVAVAAFRSQKFDVVMVVGSCVALSMILSRVISPQYLVWLAPFVVLRLRQSPAIAWLYGLAVALTLVYMLDYGDLVRHTGNVLGVVLFARNATLVALALAMVRRALWPDALSAAPKQPGAHAPDV
jgi:hypothetical protein